MLSGVEHEESFIISGLAYKPDKFSLDMAQTHHESTQCQNNLILGIGISTRGLTRLDLG